MSDSADRLAKIKQAFAEMGITYEKDEDYEEAWHNLVGYFDVLIQMDLQQKAAAKDEQKSPEKQQ